eukprot:gene12549-14728_t
MNFKKTVLLGFMLSCALPGRSQKITHALFKISGASTEIRLIELELDNNMVIGIRDGRIAYAETLSGNGLDYQAGQNWNQTNNDYGIKMAGPFPVEYYTNFDIHDPIGKIKSIGNIKFSYNNKFDIHEQFGSLKSIGDIRLTYYNAFDIHDPKGKLKSVGSVKITYFNKFDVGEDFGRIKSITGNSSSLSVSFTDRRFMQQD